MIRSLLLLPLIALAGVAVAGDSTARRQAEEAKTAAALDQQLAGLMPGRATSCLPTYESSRAQTTAYGRTLLFRVSSRLVYRNETTGGCERVGRNSGDTLVTRSNFGSLCQGDIARTVDLPARIPTGSCSLGSFVPYRKLKS